MSYPKIKNREPELRECFFAYSNEQFQQGVEEQKLQGKKIYRTHGGLFGTNEGIESLLKFYDELGKEISEKCTPQEVYDYEFGNHECSYTGIDTEAIKIVASYFTKEQTATVKRRFAFVKIEDLNFSK